MLARNNFGKQIMTWLLVCYPFFRVDSLDHRHLASKYLRADEVEELSTGEKQAVTSMSKSH